MPQSAILSADEEGNNTILECNDAETWKMGKKSEKYEIIELSRSC
jgi:hypothetical protein